MDKNYNSIQTVDEMVGRGWTYLGKYGAIYTVVGKELHFKPVNRDNKVDTDSGGVVEFEHIESNDARYLKKLFGLK